MDSSSRRLAQSFTEAWWPGDGRGDRPCRGFRCGHHRDVEIRAATLEDVDAVRDVMVRSMAALGPGFYTPEQTAAAAKYLTVPDLELIEDGTLYLAVMPSPSEITPTLPSPKGEAMIRNSLNSIVGVGGWSSRRKLFTGSLDQEGLVGRLDPEKDSARIRAFFVDPAFARRGIARGLYEACAASARAAGFRSFSLMATLPGVPLYRALGFGEERPTLVVLPDGSELPCVEMRRRLDFTTENTGGTE